MKSVNMVVVSICIVIFGVSSAMIHPHRLVIQNESEWKMQLEELNIVIDPHSQYVFRQKPETVTFAPYGQFGGRFGGKTTINVAQLMKENGIDSLPIGINLIINISKDKMQNWVYSVKTKSEAQMVQEAQAELSSIARAIDLFPRMAPYKNDMIDMQRHARYILGLPESFTEEALTRAYQENLVRLNELAQKMPSQKGIITNGISLLNQAKATLDHTKFNKFTKEEIERLMPTLWLVAADERPLELSQQQLHQSQMAVAKAFTEHDQIHRAESTMSFSLELMTTLSRAGHEFQYMTSEGFDIVPVNIKEYAQGELSGGNRSLLLAEDYNKNPKVLEKLVKEYKIHLMPKDEDLERVIKTLLYYTKQMPQLRKAIAFIKIKPVLDDYVELLKAAYQGLPFPQSDNWKIPKIVIYIGGGKKLAQQALDIIYDIFKDWRGCDRAPGFNERVTSMIFFAQGNRNDKVAPGLISFYEAPDYVYFRPDVTNDELVADYHLFNPATRR